MAYFQLCRVFSSRNTLVLVGHKGPFHLIAKNAATKCLCKPDSKAMFGLVRPNLCLNKSVPKLVRPPECQNACHSKSRALSNYLRSPVLCQRQPNKVIQTATNTGVYCSNYQSRSFHLSHRRRALPALLGTVFNISAKIGAILTGRGVRKWLKAQPKEVRRKYFKWLWMKLGALFTVGGGVAAWYYQSHLQAAPITNRERFISLTPDQYLKIADFETNSYLKKYENDMLPSGHPYYDIVLNIARRLVTTNQDFPGMASHKWTIWIVKNDEKNAFVLPNGNVFVFTGLIEFVNNEDQLAMVIGHEMAHALMLHAAEMLSYTRLLDYAVIAIMAAIWAIMPNDGIAVVTQWFYNKVMDLTVHMPYSRKIEKEADIVGLRLASKACFDVREGSVFWEKMNIAADLQNTNIPEWLSTHPSHGNRVELFDFLLPRAIEEREKNNCPRLPAVDPRDQINRIKKTVDNMKTAQKARVNIQRVRKVQRVPAWSVLNRNLIDNDSSTQDSKDSGVDVTEPLRNDSMDDSSTQEDSGKKDVHPVGDDFIDDSNNQEDSSKRDVHPLRTGSDGEIKSDKGEDSGKRDVHHLRTDSGNRDVHPLKTDSDGDIKTDKDEDSVKEDDNPLGADSNDDEDEEAEQGEDFGAVLEFTLSSCICGMEEIPNCDFVAAGNDGLRDNRKDTKNVVDTKISEMARHNSKTKEESKSSP